MPFCLVHRGNAAAARADDDRALLEQPLDRAVLEDPGRRRGGDDATPALTVEPELPAVLCLQLSRVRLVVARPYELRWVVEGWVVGIDLDHGQDRRERNLERQQVAELLLDEVADHSLRLGGEDVQRIGLDLRVRWPPCSASSPTCGPLPWESTSRWRSRHGRERLGGDPDVRALGARRHGLTAPEQSVAAQRHEHEATLVRHCDWFCGPARVPTIRP